MIRTIVTEAYSPEQEDRIRQAVEELCDRIGVQIAAGKLCTTEPALTDLLAARRPAKPMLVRLLAKLRGETVEQLLDPARPLKSLAIPVIDAEPPPPSAVGPEPPVIAAPAVSAPRVAPVMFVAPAMFDAGPQATPPIIASDVHEGLPNPVAATAEVSSGERATAASEIASDEPRLTLIEYASLSMGLELLPHRADDLHTYFGLLDPGARERESAHWTAFLQTHPRERRDWPPMRERMRQHWLRFDGQLAVPAPQAPLAETPSVSPQLEPPALPPISLEAYAALCLELHRTPANAEQVFAFYGLADPAFREPVSRYWTERFDRYPNERADWERAYHAKAQELDARARLTKAAPLPERYVAAVKPTRSSDVPPAMSLAAYALLCVELEKRPKEREQVFKRHGLDDPQKRRAVEEEWRARLERDPTELARWRTLTDEIRADWMDF